MSGHKKVRINPREKILSSDVNKAQSFSHRAVMEVARHLFSTMHNGKEDTQFVSTGTPLRALILSGLCVLPQMGSFDLYVSAGAACTTETPASGDDSAFCFAELTSNYATPGALVMTPNPAGSVRVDVIEFQRVDVTFTTENRDIYNETTKVFDTVNVPKIVGSQLVFRVRAGVAGAGYPGHAAGWCPLAIACHAPGSTSNNNVEFFDVRPLVSDFENLTQGRAGYDWNDSTYKGRLDDLQGSVKATINGSHVGGILGSAEVGAKPFNATSADGQTGGFAFPGAGSGAGSHMVYFYMLFPEGLPRWARYFPVAAGLRLPGDFKGIPVASLIAPDELGKSATSLVPPANTGLLAGATGYMFGLIATGAGGPAQFVASTRTQMRGKSYSEQEGYLSDLCGVSGAGVIPIPSNTRHANFTAIGSISGIPNAKVGALSSALTLSNLNWNATVGSQQTAIMKSTGGDCAFQAEFEADVKGAMPLNVGLSYTMINVTDAVVWGLTYTIGIYASQLTF